MGLEHVEFALAIEEAFDIQLPVGGVENSETVGQATEMLCRLLASAGRKVNAAEAASQVRSITAELSGTAADKIADSTRFREDLGWG